jgi:hypothetical protein
MKYHASDQIGRIKRLQEDARTSVAEATRAIKEADELTAELRAECGSRFVCQGVPMRLEHRAIGFAPGNRDWLVLDCDVKVVE